MYYKLVKTARGMSTRGRIDVKIVKKCLLG